jgi:peptide/nickel transport system permease protein
MLALMLRRLGWSLLTLAAVAVIVFAGVEALPGDACSAFLGRTATPAKLAKCRDSFGTDRPAAGRFVEWGGRLLQGDLGHSLKRNQPVAEVIGPRLRNTGVLAAAAALLGFPLAILLGVVSALRRDGPADLILSAAAIVAMTVPEFVSATALILVFSAWLGWFPGITVVPPDAPLLKLLPAVALPTIALALVMTAHVLRMVRTSVIEALASPYAQMALLRGVPYWRMVFGHVLPNALLPTISLMALTVAWLLGGEVVIEVVFNYPGLGRLTVDAISDRDLPLVQAIAMILAAIYIGLNLLADVLALLANPRLRTLRG